MNLKPRGSARERILLYGGAKVGKTSAYLSIARKCPSATVHVLDSDFAMDRMVEGHDDLANVKVYPVDGWEDYVENVKSISTTMAPDDWLVIDFLSGAWEAVQTWYIDKRFGKSPEDYFTQFLMSNKKGNALEGDTDWGVINKNHRALMNMIKRSKGHVLATCASKAVDLKRDTAELQTMFAVHGVRPDGQKGLPHDFHTVILLSKNRTGEYRMTTVGDRERELVKDVPLSEFATTYLLQRAGWRPA